MASSNGGLYAGIAAHAALAALGLPSVLSAAGLVGTIPVARGMIDSVLKLAIPYPGEAE